MAEKHSFQQILEEKMNTPEGNSGFSERESDSDIGKTSISEGKSAFETLIATLLVGNVNFRFGFSPEHVTDVSRKVRATYGPPPPREKAKKAQKPERTALVKNLNTQANQALCTLVELGSTELKNLELLSESSVKRAFRRLALRLHPDQNVHVDGRDFRRAHAAYSVLMSVFTK